MPKGAPNSFVRENLNLHKGAIICFAIAILFYLFSWSKVATGLAVFGVLFEMVAWIIMFIDNSDTEK
jgi:hypothetical protein